MPRKTIDRYIDDLRAGRRIPLTTFRGFWVLLANSVIVSLLLLGLLVDSLISQLCRTDAGTWYDPAMLLLLGLVVGAPAAFLWGLALRGGIQLTVDCLKYWDWRGREHSVLLTGIERVVNRRSFVQVSYRAGCRKRRALLEWLHARIGDALVGLLAERADLAECRRGWVGLTRADVYQRHDACTREARE